MSAFQQSEHHIGAIIRWASQEAEGGRWPRSFNGPDNATAAFRLLADANIESLRARYGDMDDWAPVTQSKPIHDYPLLTLAELFVALRGYEYQACEHEGWELSPAWRFVDMLRAKAISKVPGVSDAETWGISETFGADRPQGPVPLMSLLS